MLVKVRLDLKRRWAVEQQSVIKSLPRGCDLNMRGCFNGLSSSANHGTRITAKHQIKQMTHNYNSEEDGNFKKPVSKE